MLARTTWGFKLYALGTNASATHFAKVNNTLVLIETYMMSGTMDMWSYDAWGETTSRTGVKIGRAHV